MSKKVAHKMIHPIHHVPENHLGWLAIDAKKDDKEKEASSSSVGPIRPWHPPIFLPESSSHPPVPVYGAFTGPESPFHTLCRHYSMASRQRI